MTSPSVITEKDWWCVYTKCAFHLKRNPKDINCITFRRPTPKPVMLEVIAFEIY